MGIMGNATDAQFILNWVHGGSLSYEEQWDRSRGYQGAPEGWKFLGHGSFRSVWQSPDGTAYKVDHSYGGYMSDNRDEINNVLKLLKSCQMPEGTRLPSMTCYALDGRDVIAVECIKGKVLNSVPKGERFWQARDKMRDIAKATLLTDVHYQNVMLEDDTDTLVLVDIQM